MGTANDESHELVRHSWGRNLPATLGHVSGDVNGPTIPIARVAQGLSLRCAETDGDCRYVAEVSSTPVPRRWSRTYSRGPSLATGVAIVGYRLCGLVRRQAVAVDGPKTRSGGRSASQFPADCRRRAGSWSRPRQTSSYRRCCCRALALVLGGCGSKVRGRRGAANGVEQ